MKFKTDPAGDRRAAEHARIEATRTPPIVEKKRKHCNALALRIASTAKIAYYKAEWALKIFRCDPQLALKVEHGELSLYAATKIVAPPKPKPERGPERRQLTWRGETEVQFLERMRRETLAVLKEVEVVGTTRWQPDKTSKLALARGLHAVLTEVTHRLDGLQAKLTPTRKRGQSVKRREDAVPPQIGGIEENNNGDSESVFHTGTTN